MLVTIILIVPYVVLVYLIKVSAYGRGRSVGRLQGASTILEIMAKEAEEVGATERARAMREAAVFDSLVGHDRIDRMCDRIDRMCDRIDAKRGLQ